MKEEIINQLAEEYVKQHLVAFKKIAERAYKDGLRDAEKYRRMELEAENSEFDYGHNVDRRGND